jgi:hypothetical protein
MKYWWVNQNQTLKYEITGGYMWPPKTKANGGSNKFYDYMTEVGDVVFSLSKKSRLCASFIIGMYPFFYKCQY